TLCGLGRFRPAVADWSRAIDLDDGRYHNSLRLKRASTLYHLKDHERASADAQAIAASSKATAEDLYDAARVYAACTQLAAQDGPVAESYAGTAVSLLRRAVAQGYKDRARIKNHSDLNPLRSREDFKKLMHELEDGQHGSGLEE